MKLTEQEWKDGGKPEVPTIIKPEPAKDQQIIKIIKDEEARLRGRHQWLNNTDAIGMGVFLASNFLIILCSYLYYIQYLGPVSTILLIAFWVSIHVSYSRYLDLFPPRIRT